MTYMIPTKAIYTGRRWSGTAAAAMTKLLVTTPALPKPATARPTIKVIEVRATPHNRDPTSNKNNEARNTFLTEKSLKMRPNMGWKAHAVSMYAEPYHPMSGVDWNSCVMYGMA